MDKEMEIVLGILKSMGGKNVRFDDDNEEIYFEFSGKRVNLIGLWHNDDTAGVAAIVTDL